MLAQLRKSSGLILLLLLCCLSVAVSHNFGRQSTPLMALPTKPAAAAQAIKSNFSTPWQDETQYVVQFVCTDIAEMLYFCKYHRGLGDNYWVTAEGLAPVNNKLQYRVSAKIPEGDQIEAVVVLNTSIWDPATYLPFTSSFGQKLGVQGKLTDSKLKAEELCEPTPETLAKWDKILSSECQLDNSNWHDQSALLLTSLALREHSGKYYNVRHELCRAAAHLTVSEYFQPKTARSGSSNHYLAKALLATLYGDQTSALKRLDELPKGKPYTTFRNALRVRLTGDWRTSIKGVSLLENLEVFASRSHHVDESKAWRQRPQVKPKQADWYRIANQEPPGVEIGHEVFGQSLQSELAEQTSVCKEMKWGTPSIKLLNEVPQRCVAGSTCQVLGRGTWAGFWQRHLCHTLECNFGFLDEMLGVPDDAQQYYSKSQEFYGELYLYPLIESRMTRDDQAYRRAQDQSMALVHKNPHLVPALAWNNICYEPRHCKLYIPPPHGFVNEWHHFNPLAGTAYDLHPRFNHPSLTGAPDFLERLKQLHTLAPYDTEVSEELVEQMRRQGKLRGVAFQEELYKPMLAYSSRAIRHLAYDDNTSPERCRQLLEQGCKIDDSFYPKLAKKYKLAGLDDKAAKTLESWITTEPDSVSVSHEAGWLCHYYESHGNSARATKIADAAAETYSRAGLGAKASLLFERGQYKEAQELLVALQQRYNNGGPLLNFLRLMSAKQPQGPWKSQITALEVSFPEPLALYDPASPPSKGITVVESWGALRPGDTIVACRGYQVARMEPFEAIWSWDSSLPVPCVVLRDGKPTSLQVVPVRFDRSYFGIK
jgi:tetratricopeptide (TPR) repeat protein